MVMLLRAPETGSYKLLDIYGLRANRSVQKQIVDCE